MFSKINKKYKNIISTNNQLLEHEQTEGYSNLLFLMLSFFCLRPIEARSFY